MRYFLVLLLFTVAMISCSDSSDNMDLVPISNIRIYDNGNSNTGADIEVNFDKQLSSKGILGYRVFFVPNNVASFDQSQAEELSSDLYSEATYSQVFPIQGIQLSASSKSIDGSVIQEGIKYSVAVLTVTDDPKQYNNSFSFESTSFELSINNQIKTFVTLADTIGAGIISIDANDNLYVPTFNILDELGAGFSSNSSIIRISKNASLSTILRNIDGQVGGVHIDENDQLFSVLRTSQEIGVSSATGSEMDLIEPQGFRILDPVGLYISPDKTLYVADKRGSAILKITEQGETSLLASVENNPRGITGDDSGNLYISHDNQQGTITKITPDGDVSTLANIPTYIPADYTIEYVMWVGHITYHDDFLYVAGMSTDRIYKVSLDGAVEVFAGSGTRGIPRGGALTANLNRPYSVAWNEEGNQMYISGSGDITPQHVQGSLPGKIWVIDIVE